MKTRACAKTRSLLPFYLENEVDPAEALDAASHLARCERCAALAERERKVLRALRSLEAPAPPRDLASGVMTALRALKRRAANSRALKWAAVASVIIFMVFDLTHWRPQAAAGLRFLARLGELMNLDGIAGRIAEFAARLLPPPSRVSDILIGATFRSDPGALSLHDIAALLATAAVIFAALMAPVIFGGIAIVRPSFALRRRLRRLF